MSESEKTIDQWREEFQNIGVKEAIKKMFDIKENVREEIIIAFVAKYLLNPEEVLACEQYGNIHEPHRFWVEKRSEDHIKQVTNGRIRSYEYLYEKYNKLLEFVKMQARIDDDIYSLENSDDYGDALTAMQMRDSRKLLKEIGEL